jgi:hypothetical protein
LQTDNPSIQELLLWPEMADVKAELDNPKFATRRHGSRATSALGCDGPLCKKAERDRMRRRNQLKAQQAGREFRPRTRKYDRDALLEAIYDWHIVDLAVRRVRPEAS